MHKQQKVTFRRKPNKPNNIVYKYKNTNQNILGAFKESILHIYTCIKWNMICMVLYV